MHRYLECVFLKCNADFNAWIVCQAPEGIHTVCKRFPLLKIVTSEIDAGLNQDYRVVPGMGDFGDRYFGTDDDGPEQMHKAPIEPKLITGLK